MADTEREAQQEQELKQLKLALEIAKRDLEITGETMKGEEVRYNQRRGMLEAQGKEIVALRRVNAKLEKDCELYKVDAVKQRLLAAKAKRKRKAPAPKRTVVVHTPMPDYLM